MKPSDFEATSCRFRRVGHLDACQGHFGGFLVLSSADSLAVLVQQGHAFLCPRQGVVPAIRLFPAPSRPVRLSSLFSSPAHNPPEFPFVPTSFLFLES